MIFFLYLKLKTTYNHFQRKRNSTQTGILLISKTYCTQTFLVQFYKCASCKCNILHGQIHYSKLQSFVVEGNQLNLLILSRMTFINIYFQMKSFDNNFVCVLLAFLYHKICALISIRHRGKNELLSSNLKLILHFQDQQIVFINTTLIITLSFW